MASKFDTGMRCASCHRMMVIAWSVDTVIWRLLAKKWWSKVLCLECFIALASQRQKNLVILEVHNFRDIIFCAKRVRGSLLRKWPFRQGRRFEAGLEVREP